jgi:hypothetical protein
MVEKGLTKDAEDEGPANTGSKSGEPIVAISVQGLVKRYKIGKQVVCAVGIGMVAAYFVDQTFAPDLTAQAQYNFGGLDLEKRVSLAGVNLQQLGLIVPACFATGVLSMIVPLVRNVRRSMIRDMREE